MGSFITSPTSLSLKCFAWAAQSPPHLRHLPQTLLVTAERWHQAKLSVFHAVGDLSCWISLQMPSPKFLLPQQKQFVEQSGLLVVWNGSHSAAVGWEFCFQLACCLHIHFIIMHH